MPASPPPPPAASSLSFCLSLRQPPWLRCVCFLPSPPPPWRASLLLRTRLAPSQCSLGAQRCEDDQNPSCQPGREGGSAAGSSLTGTFHCGSEISAPHLLRLPPPPPAPHPLPPPTSPLPSPQIPAGPQLRPVSSLLQPLAPFQTPSAPSRLSSPPPFLVPHPQTLPAPQPCPDPS